jgi:hypothetical protein
VKGVLARLTLHKWGIAWGPHLEHNNEDASHLSKPPELLGCPSVSMIVPLVLNMELSKNHTLSLLFTVTSSKKNHSSPDHECLALRHNSRVLLSRRSEEPMPCLI